MYEVYIFGIQNILLKIHDIIIKRKEKQVILMSSAKLPFATKPFASIKIPWNITEEQLEYTIIGALLFALAASLYFYVFGRLIGRKSLVQLLKSVKSYEDKVVWITVMAGVIFCSSFMKELHHEHHIDFYPFDSNSYIKNTDEVVLAIAGFLVGVGSGLAGGCTFGHGVSGLARRKKASILSVIIFCVVAHLTNRYNLSQKIPQQWSSLIKLKLPSNIKSDYYIQGSLVVPFLFFIIFKDKSLKGLVKYILNFVIGIVLGLGMIIGGLTKRQIVLESLDFNSRFWNPSMPIFYAITFLICSITLGILIRKKITPIFAESMENPQEKITFGLIVGSVFFGAGWGLGGLCPGPMYALIPSRQIKVPFYWGISCIIGFGISDLLTKIGKLIFSQGNSTKQSSTS